MYFHFPCSLFRYPLNFFGKCYESKNDRKENENDMLISVLQTVCCYQFYKRYADISFTNGMLISVLQRVFLCINGPSCSVGIATDHGLDGPGSNPGGDEIFRPPDRPWGPPVQRVPSLSRGRGCRGVGLTPHPI